MLVEINLLAEKEKKDVTNILIFAIVFMLISLVTIFTLLYINNAESEISHLNSEVEIASAEVSVIQEQIAEQTSSDKAQLEQTIQSIEGEIVPVSLLLEHLVSLLPDEGYLLNFDYSVSGEVSFNAQFDQFEEVAAYSRFLMDSELVHSVNLSRITTDSMPPANNVGTNYLPRYIGSFTLQMNQQAINELRDRQ